MTNGMSTDQDIYESSGCSILFLWLLLISIIIIILMNCSFADERPPVTEPTASPCLIFYTSDVNEEAIYQSYIDKNGDLFIIFKGKQYIADAGEHKLEFLRDWQGVADE